MTSLCQRNESFARVGIVGAGHAAVKGHLPVFKKLTMAKVVAICDTVEEKARKAAEQFQLPSYYHNFNTMLQSEKFDIIDILTSSDTHVELAIEAMDNGCNCIMEKPLSVTTADADKVIKKARETGLGLFVIHNYSFFPGLRKARAIVDSGVLGEVVEVDVRYLTSLGAERYFDPNHWCHRLPGGIFADISPHLVMVLLDFLDNVKNVKALTTKVSEYPFIAADELKVMIEAENGLGSFTLSFNSPVRQFTVDITGTKMSLTIDASTQIVICHKPVTRDQPILSAVEGIPRGLMELSKVYQQIKGLSDMTIGVIMGKRNALEGHKYLINSALTAIQNKIPYPVDINKCRDVVWILEEVFKYIEKKEPNRLE